MRNTWILRLRARAARRLAHRGPVITAAFVGLLASVNGCAEERDPINRVQANALAKSFFVGPNLESTEDDPEFFKRGTVVDVGYGAAQDGLFTATYAQPVSRIRWEITEKTLNARLAYERIKGTDGKGNPRDGVEKKAANDGQIVASYEIESHFDIRRDYNPQTGEELNIVVENESDRPWYARAHFRVDWAKNLVTDSYDFDTLSQLGVFGGVKYDPFAYTVTDAAHPDAPHFESEAGYFDVTNKAYATPQIVDLSGLDVGAEQFPACMLSTYFEGGTEPWGNCGPIEITIRESYRKVPPSDYEPADHDGVRFQVLGAFNFDYRRSYARNYGILDRDWMRFLARYDIWERSHYYADPEKMTGPIACATKATTEDATGDPTADPNRDDDGDGTADECAAAGIGAHCDVYTQKCALPYRQRKPKTIPWYIAGDTTLFESTNWAVLEWDLAVRTAVQTARLTECRRLGGGAECNAPFAMWTGQQEDIDEAVRITRDVDACRRKDGYAAPSCIDLARAAGAAVAAERGAPDDPSALAIGTVAAMDPVIVLCHNPVTATDHAACGKAGLVARPGDLRYNIVLNVEAPQTPSPWGIMVDGNDPLTGEKVAGSMNVWTHVTDIAAQQVVDLIRYINGELTTEQITNGSYVRDWAGASRLGSGAGPLLSNSEVVARLAAGTKLEPAAFDVLTRGTPPPEVQRFAAKGKDRALDVEVRSDVASPSTARLKATLNRGRGSAVEAQLLNSAILQLAGKGGGTGTEIGNVSPLSIQKPRLSARLRQARENALAARGACIVGEAPEPTSLTGLSDILRQKFPPTAGESVPDRQARNLRMLDYVRQHYHYAIVAHEMGHSIGLRHNFVSSSAPLFYRPQYWQLRTKNGAVTTPCTDAVTDGSSCVGPRYWDPVTDEEQSQLITMWMQSSVMDYAGDAGQDLIGLGVTDFAATRFFYGDVVSVYTNPDYRARTSVGTGITASTDSFGGLLGIRYGLRSTSATGVDEFNYSQLQNSYKVITGCRPVTPQAPPDWPEATLGKWHPVLDGHVVSVDGQPSKCRQQPVDYVPYTQLRMPTVAENNDSPYRGSPSVDPANRLRVPYAFGTDTWADIGNVSVFRHDNGADPYEQVQFLITTQENRHIFDNYRRDRTTFSVRGAADRSFDRYNAKLQAIAGGMGFLASIYDDLSTNQGYAFDSVWPIIVKDVVRDNMIAATVAFDHFTRELGRPEPGEHAMRALEFNDPVLHSLVDPDDFGGAGPINVGRKNLVIPNGSTGYLRDVGFGGHPLENRLPEGAGEFRIDYVQNAGSYYDKINIATLLAESEDRFISESRRDFYDSRFRAVGVADVLGEGVRRVIANALTGDRSLLAPRVAADAMGQPLLDTGADIKRDPLANRYPAQPLGWPSFWPRSGPETCYSSAGRIACTNYGGGDFDPLAPPNSVPVDPQIGWEVQKFLIVWTISHIKANEKTAFTDMMRLYPLGVNSKPEFEGRIEWQDPTSGQLYYARTFGKECLYGDAKNGCAGGKMVQKGIAARVLEYANELTSHGYKLDVVNFPATTDRPAGQNPYGRAIILHHPDGSPIIMADPAIRNLSPAGDTLTPIPDCDQNLDATCAPVLVNQNHYAHELRAYKSVPDYLYQAGVVYGLFEPPGKLGGALRENEPAARR